MTCINQLINVHTLNLNSFKYSYYNTFYFENDIDPVNKFDIKLLSTYEYYATYDLMKNV